MSLPYYLDITKPKLQTVYDHIQTPKCDPWIRNSLTLGTGQGLGTGLLWARGREPTALAYSGHGAGRLEDWLHCTIQEGPDALGGNESTSSMEMRERRKDRKKGRWTGRERERERERVR